MTLLKLWTDRKQIAGGRLELVQNMSLELVQSRGTVVLNTNPYTYLGNRPLDLSPHATLDRGLVVLTFRTMSATAIVRSVAGALKGGGMEPGPHLDIRVDVERLVVEHDTPFPYQVDGDALGSTTRLDFWHVPAAVKLVFPDNDT